MFKIMLKRSWLSIKRKLGRTILGGTVSIQADMETIRDNQKEDIEKGGDPSEMFKNMARPSIDVKTAK